MGCLASDALLSCRLMHAPVGQHHTRGSSGRIHMGQDRVDERGEQRVEDRGTYLPFLELAIAHRGVAVAFADAALRHKRMEEDFNKRLLPTCPTPAALSFPHMQLAPAQYW